jgi:hypothetical protein
MQARSPHERFALAVANRPMRVAAVHQTVAIGSDKSRADLRVKEPPLER